MFRHAVLSLTILLAAALLPAAAAAKSPDRGGLSCQTIQKQAAQGDRLRQLLEKYRDKLGVMVEEPERFRMQIQVSEVVPAIELGGDKDGERGHCLVTHRFRAGEEYFYPASAIKTVAAVGALQMARERQAAGSPKAFGLDDVMWYRRPVEFDALPEATFEVTRGGTLREIIERTLVVSSNQGFNKLYDIVGHAELNERMWAAGLKSVRMQHRMFSRRTLREQKWSPVVFVEIPETADPDIAADALITPGADDEEGDEQGGRAGDTDANGKGRGEGLRKVRLRQIRPERRSDLELPAIPAEGVKVGEKHTDFITGKFFEKPMDFSTKNYISIGDLQAMMIGLLRPELGGATFGDLGDFPEFLLSVMGKHPPMQGSEEEKRAAERRFMPLYPGFAKVIDRDRLKYVNKGGRAYGFHLENAYVRDEKTGRAVFVTAVVYVNDNAELNDNEYEYEERSYPFFETLGEAVAEEFLAR